MSTQVQAEMGAALEALGFEIVPSGLCGGDQQYVATDKTRALLEPVLAGESKLTLTGSGDFIAS